MGGTTAGITSGSSGGTGSFLDCLKIFSQSARKTENSKPEIVCAVSLKKSGKEISDTVLVLGGISETPLRLKLTENKLSEGSLANADAVQDSVMDEIVKYTEKKDQGAYLNYISGVMAAGCVGRCMKKDISGDA